MKVEQTQLEGCFICKPNVLEDERGYFYEGFNAIKFKEQTGVDFEVKQLNQSRSSFGVLRGLHFQSEPKAQAKLISCTEGEILDVAVDLRSSSKTFGQHVAVRLSDDNKKQLFIPKGMAHGFLVLSKNAKLMYMVDDVYSPEHDSGISPIDPDLRISWGIDSGEIILSQKDHSLKNLRDANVIFK